MSIGRNGVELLTLFNTGQSVSSNVCLLQTRLQVDLQVSNTMNSSQVTRPSCDVLAQRKTISEEQIVLATFREQLGGRTYGVLFPIDSRKSLLCGRYRIDKAWGGQKPTKISGTHACLLLNPHFVPSGPTSANLSKVRFQRSSSLSAGFRAAVKVSAVERMDDDNRDVRG